MSHERLLRCVLHMKPAGEALGGFINEIMQSLRLHELRQWAMAMVPSVGLRVKGSVHQEHARLTS